MFKERAHVIPKRKMHFEGNFEVLVNSFRKNILLERGDARHEEIRPLLYMGLGGTAGVRNGGCVIGLEKYKLSHVFNWVVTNSSGGPGGAFLLSLQGVLGTNIYPNECTTPQFMSVPRMLRGGHFMGVRYLANEGFRKKLDQKTLKESRTDFYVVVTKGETGETVLINVKDHADVVDPIEATISIPGISDGGVFIDGDVCWDGGPSPLPIAEIQKFNPTDILFIMSHSERDSAKHSLIEEFLLPLFMRDMSPALRSAFSPRRRSDTFKKQLASIRVIQEKTNSESKIPRIGIFWPDAEDGVGSFTKNKSKLIKGAKRTEAFLNGLLETARAKAEADIIPAQSIPRD